MVFFWVKQYNIPLRMKNEGIKKIKGGKDAREKEIN
jgi:hypothetical protein